MDRFDKTGIEKKIRKAAAALVKYDRILLELNVNERSITHRLAMYLQKEFPKWDVDCEYNRRGFDPKTLQNLQHCQRRQDGDDTDGSRVYPDIIVHHRKEEENLLVIEVKKSTSGYTNDCDEEKLKEFRSQPQYKYSFGIFLKLRTGTNDISQQNVIKKLRFIPKT